MGHTDDATYMRDRAEAAGVALYLHVFPRGFTVDAVELHGRASGSSSYFTERPTDPLPDGCFRMMVDQAIAGATR